MQSGKPSSFANVFSILAVCLLIGPRETQAQSSGFGVSDLNSNTVFSFPSGNLVSNHSFEVKYGEAYQAWDMGGLPTAPTAGIKPRSGMSMAAISHSAGTIPPGQPTERSYFPCDFFRVKPATAYTAYFYYMAKNPSNWGADGVRPMVKTFAGRSESAEVFDMSSGRHGLTPYQQADNWTLYTHSFTTGPSAVYARIELLRTNAAAVGGDFYFDDVYIVEADRAGSDLPEKVQKAAEFYDGLNRSIQTLQYDGDRDIVVATEYDPLGRRISTSEPIGADFLSESGRHGYVADWPSFANDYYDGTCATNGICRPDAEGYPFDGTSFENTPLGRKQVIARSGLNWNLESSHALKRYYSSTASASSNDDEPEPPTANDGNYFYQFMKGAEVNEKRQEFTDKFGNLVAEAVRSGNSWISTEYRYDHNGNVTEVIHPEGQGGTRLVSESEYNTLGQKIRDKSDDIGDYRYIYDQSGRLRFTQSKKQSEIEIGGIPAPEFSYIKYDGSGRVIETGEYLDGSAFTNANAQSSSFPDNGSRIPKAFYFYDKLPLQWNFCSDPNPPGHNIPGNEFYVLSDFDPTNPHEFPDLNSAHSSIKSTLAGRQSFPSPVRIFQVFDPPESIISPPLDYEFDALTLSDGQEIPLEIIAITKSSPEYPPVFGQPLPFTVEWGPLKGRIVQSVTCNNDVQAPSFPTVKEVFTVFNYDKFGNIVDQFEYNGYIATPDDRWQRIHLDFNTEGRATKKTVYRNALSSEAVILSYQYDHLKRLIRILDSDNNTVVFNTYNAIGQLERIELGKGSDKITILHSYHLHGGIKKIESKRTFEGVTQTLYSEELKYEDGTHPLFNGMITEKVYTLLGDVERKYEYLYDDLSRLLEAKFPNTAPIPSRPGVPLKLNAKYAYYENGALKRQLRAGQPQPQEEQYQYYEGTNRVSHILGKVDATPGYSRDMSAAGTFQFDANGNMYGDISKDLSISYESSDKPFLFDYNAGGQNFKVYMIYGHDGGRKSKLTYQNDALVEAKHYVLGAKEIRESFEGGGDTEHIYNLESYGRIRLSTPTSQQKEEFYLQDHSGSTVLVVKGGVDLPLHRSENFNYGHQAYEVSNTESPITPKFAGKELDKGSELSYFGARYYDADIGLWISPDPARQYHSPYAYGPGNPINGVDRDGNLFDENAEAYYTELACMDNPFYGSTTLEADLTAARNDPSRVFILGEALGNTPFQEGLGSDDAGRSMWGVYLPKGLSGLDRAVTFRHETAGHQYQLKAPWHENANSIRKQMGLTYRGFLQWNFWQMGRGNADPVYYRDYKVYRETEGVVWDADPFPPYYRK